MLCPSCQTDNDASAGNCRSCGQPLGLGPGAVIAGRYEIKGILGEGGMGTVYKAFDRSLEEAVALKVLRPSFAQTPEADRRFRSEIKLARKVSHRNVCRIHEYGEDGRLRYLSMEYIDGETLEDLVKRSGKLPLREAMRIFRQILDGLQEAHNEGVIHGDLKPTNILITLDGTVKLLDFGLARVLDPGAWTVKEALSGTPGYWAPEQAMNGPVDARTDIYSAGVILYELLEGERPPFEPPAPFGPKVPLHVQTAIQRSINYKPSDRFGAIEDLRAALTSNTALDIRYWQAPQWTGFLLACLLIVMGLVVFSVRSARDVIGTAGAVGEALARQSAPAAVRSVAILTEMDPAIAEVFVAALRRDGEFEVVERPKIDKVITELQLNQQEIVDPRTAQRIGLVVGAQYLMFGSSQKVPDGIQINARLVRTETTKVIAAETVTGKLQETPELVERLVRMLRP